MLTSQKMLVAVVASMAVATFGAGCSRQGSSAIPSSALKQPAPAKAPVAQPQIPPEAVNIPKPY